MSNVDRWIGHWARQTTDAVAIEFEGSELTYGDLRALCDRYATILAEHAVSVGDRVVMCAFNRPDLIALLAACARLGAILVPLNNRLTATEHRFQIDDCDPAVLVVGDGFGARLAEVAPNRPLIDVDGIDRAATSALPPAVPSDPSRPVLMVYTSGTTGTPKGAIHTNRSLLFTVLNGVAHQDLSARDRILTFLPLFHVGGLNIQTLPTLYVGGTVILHRRFDPAAVLATIADRRPTQTLMVPAVMQAVTEHPDFASTDLSSLDGINTGSSVVPPPLIERFLDRGVDVGQIYGSTETGPTVIVLRYADGAPHIGSCGKPAIHSEMRIARPDGTDAGTGEPGELWVRGPNLFTGYWNRDDATQRAFEGDWYRTGDVGRIDEQGFLFIEDRIKDMLISGGENIYPAEVENVLIDHPAIGEVAVIGRPDERWGEVPVAVVVAAGEARPPSADELSEWCADKLARYKHPREVVVMDTLPRTALGKVTKHILREMTSDPDE